MTQLKQTPNISVIVPVYNVEKYVEQCLNTLVNQTLQNIEIIAIIDGSTDNSENIVRTFSGKHRNIKMICTENRGLAAARNDGIRYAQGEYIAFVDSDDWVDTDMYENMFKLAKENDADIVACNFLFEYEDGPRDVQPGMESKLILDKNEAMHDVLLAQNMNNCAWNKIYRNNLFNYNIWFTEGRYYEDLYPMLQWLNLTKKIYLTNKTYYHYRRARSGSITAKFSKKHITDYVFLIENMRNWLQKNNMLNQFQEEFATCSFRIYNQLVYNIFFANVQNRYTYYKDINTKFSVNKYFTYNTVRAGEDNKFFLITILGKLNRSEAGRKFAFYTINLASSLIKIIKKK